ncbi:ABC transporter permease [Fimbriimonas ginsengisoli]|uniref:Autoinducer 2 import system permease protein LsrC n=1 Tax=Fimbriimonas ginsengisoli Gsoil 348 TaxID=661478 RepID=A0A068NV14_FIMGI|nr:ABC transporter permease [Fimbriimonas ginsengisoli]AIE85434.1 inner-membrane translocator [Fimbriimonas ginsengisoli Gsoil 348]
MNRAFLQRVAAMREAGTVVLLLMVMVVAGIREPRFLQAASLESILLWVPLLVVIGIGQMMVIVTRGIDVSVGSMVGLSGMIVGMTFRSHPGLPIFEGTLIGVGVGLALGAVNGGLIAGARVPPIIATLGTMSVFRGLVFIVSRGEQVDSNYIPDGLTRWTLAGPVTVFGIVFPWILVIALAMAAIAAWFVRKTRAGRDIYALGSHPEAARLRGIPVRRTTFMVYAITGALAGLAGVLYASRYGVVNPGSAGQGLELLVIAAVVIGGTNVVGGSGTVLGVLLGSLFLGAVNVALAVLGITETWQQLVYGAVILIAVVVDTLLQKKVAA